MRRLHGKQKKQKEHEEVHVTQQDDDTGVQADDEATIEEEIDQQAMVADTTPTSTEPIIVPETPRQQKPSNVPTSSTPLQPTTLFPDVTGFTPQIPTPSAFAPWNPNPSTLPYTMTPSLMQWLSMYPGNLGLAPGSPFQLSSQSVPPFTTPSPTNIPPSSTTPTPTAVPPVTPTTPTTPSSSLSATRRSPSEIGSSSRAKKKSKTARFSLKKPAPKKQ